MRIFVAAAAACLALTTSNAGAGTGPKDVVDVASESPDHTTLVAAVKAAEYVVALKNPGPLTVFAPTNDAFTAALAELSLTKAQLLASPALPGILTYHVVAGDVRAADVVALPKPANVATVQGESFTVNGTTSLQITDARARVANLVATDVIASNGVIHLIDKVILPAP